MTATGLARGRTGVSGVILAAGRSTRLGRPKQLLDLGGEPLLHHVVRHAASSSLDEVVLVLGHEADRVARAVGGFGQRVVVNPRFAEGLSTSVAVGLAAIDPDADAVLFLLGDQPGIGPPVIDAIIDRFQETRAPIVMPTYGGTPANPVLFAREILPEFAQITGDEGARSIIQRHRELVAFVEAEMPRVPQDIDTEADYQTVLDDFKTGTYEG